MELKNNLSKSKKFQKVKKFQIKLSKKAIFFTMDALLAFFLLIGAVLFMMNRYSALEDKTEQKVFISQDVLICLSELKINEINNSFVSQEIFMGHIDDTSLSVIEQMGKYWALNYTDKSLQLFESIVPSSLLLQGGARITLGDEEIFFKNTTSKSTVITSSRMIAGIAKEVPLTGYSSTAYLKKISNKKSSSYFYFGGFIGQGKIDFFIDDFPLDFDYSKTSLIYLEGDFAGNFSFYINNKLCNSTPSQQIFRPTNISGGNVDSWNLTYCNESLISGRNNFTINFSSLLDNSYVAGGFLKIQYRTDELTQNITLGQGKYYFPGIRGIANLYDSFYIPGDLETMNIFLHFNSTEQTYLSIGERVISMNASGITTISLNNTYLSEEENFDYVQLSRNTIPLRFASYNATTEIVSSGNADIILITDFSGSMKKAVADWTQGNLGSKCDDIYSDPHTRRTDLVKCVDNEFVDTVLNYSGNRVWPVFIYMDNTYYYNNPEDNVAIKGYIDHYINGNGKTCLSCAVNLGYEILKNNSNSSRKKFIVLMSDGVPTHCASGSCTSNSSIFGVKYCEGLCDETSACNETQIPGQCTACTTNSSPANNLIYSANRSVKDLNVTIYTIGFGPMEECILGNSTLNQVAIIGNGTYQHSANNTVLRLIYQNISYEILNQLEQTNQSVKTKGNLTYSDIYWDSYINFTFNPIIDEITSGEISAIIQIPLLNCTSSVYIPSGIKVIDAKAVSYSGIHWSDILVLNNETLFNLSSYFVPYYKLGDPLVIQIPVDKLISGINTIFLDTGDSPENRTNCSKFNSFIYTAMIPSATQRTEVLETNIGCNWQVAYEDGDIGNIIVPEGYVGEKICSYLPGNITYNNKDTYDVAVYNLFRQLDTDNNGAVLVNINKLDLEIITTTIQGVPYLWGPSTMKLEIWR